MQHCLALRCMYDLLFWSVWFCYRCSTCNRYYDCNTLRFNMAVDKRISHYYVKF